MKKRVFAVVCCGILLLAAAGCGTNQTEVTEESAAQEGPAVADIFTDEYDGEAEDIVYDVNNLSDEQQRMFGPMGALIYCYESDSATGHKWADAGWGTLSTLTNDFSTMQDAGTRAYGEENDHYLILGSFLEECASAMYADFNGELPPIPASEDIVSWGIQNQQGDYYYFLYGDRGMDSHDFFISAWTEHADGTCSVEMQEWFWEPYSLAAIYDVELVKNEYSASQADPYFIYSVASITLNNEKTEAYLAEHPTSTDDYILADSDTRYYSESELGGLSKDELRLARNEIYARHGRKFDDTELQNYFDGKTWYQGTIEPADFTDSMLNTYEKENIKIIQRVENSSGQSTGGSTSSSGFSFADIEGMGFGFSSGVGAWSTDLIVYADGTFEGEFSDWDAGGSVNDEYPRGEFAYSEFKGKFSDPLKVNDYTYSVKVEYLNQMYEPGTSEIKDEYLFNYTDTYGVDAGDEFLIYLPGAPTASLPEGYLDWIYFSGDFPSYLPFYGLYNTSEGAGFRGY